MLGFIHEHQNPAGKMPWDKPVVYAELKQRFGWTEAQVDTNVFDCFDALETNFTTPDESSVMAYPIPAHWTTDGSSWPLNTKLSNSDKAAIQSLYG
jgi:hypothetical protein